METVRMSLQLLEPKDAVRAQSQRPEAQAVQRTLEDIPKATRCEKPQDPTPRVGKHNLRSLWNYCEQALGSQPAQRPRSAGSQALRPHTP